MLFIHVLFAPLFDDVLLLGGQPFLHKLPCGILPAAGLGAIVMPWLIGLIAQSAGLRMGMAVNILPCVGMLALAVVLCAADRADSRL